MCFGWMFSIIGESTSTKYPCLQPNKSSFCLSSINKMYNKTSIKEKSAKCQINKNWKIKFHEENILHSNGYHKYEI